MSALADENIAKDNAKFPYAPEDWDMGKVEGIALELGLNLTDDHWRAIRALQEYFARHDVPHHNIRELHDALDELFHQKGGIKYVYELFPGGPVVQGCRLSGLQAPSGSIDESFGSVQ